LGSEKVTKKRTRECQGLATLYNIDDRGGTGSGLPESTPEGFCVFLSDPDPDP